jgi:hypothetical protein
MRARNWPGKAARHTATRRAASAALQRMAYDEAMRPALVADTSDLAASLVADGGAVADGVGPPPAAAANDAPARANDANDANDATGSPPPDTPPMPVSLLAWWPAQGQDGAYLGMADVRLGRALRLRNVSVWRRDGDLAAFPPTHTEWETREAHERFSDAVIAAIRAAHPGDLDMKGET